MRTAFVTRSLLLARLMALVLAVGVLLLLRVIAPIALSAIEERTGSWLWKISATAHDERRVVLVDIDEASLAQLGAWPWPRERMAALSDRLTALGASQQIYDMVFPEARQGDAAFQAALTRTPSVLAQVFAVDQGGVTQGGVLQGALTSPVCAAATPAAHGYIANTATLHAEYVGHITPRIAPDGAVRHVPALVCLNQKSYPALALAALMAGTEAGKQLMLTAGQGWLAPDWQLTLPSLPDQPVPLDAEGNLRVPYRLAPSGLVSVSAVDVLEGRVPKGMLNGAWVLVGATAFGVGDAVPTPHGGAVAGVSVHAQLLTALLDDALPFTPRIAVLYQFLLGLVAAGVLLGMAHSRARLPVYALPLLGLGLGGGMFALHAGFQLHSRYWLGWLNPALFALLAGAVLAMLEHARSRFERERLFSNFASYLPAPVAAALALRAPEDGIRVERREVTVLFADLRNFSAYCEARPPEETAAVLQTFFATATDIIEAHGGIVESLQGDAVMAVWDAPTPCPDHPSLALAAAQALQQHIPPQLPDPSAHGLEQLALGVGIETGTALVGSFGLARRRTHTVLGQTVTVAARLQALTADVAEPILLGSGAAKHLPEGTLYSLGDFLLEGLRQPCRLYAPIAPVVDGQ